MIHVGTEKQTAIYHCKNCGYDRFAPLPPGSGGYLRRRSMLLGRVENGVIEWELTQWDDLRREISDFTAAFDMARNDIGLKMAVIACLTKGFHDLDDERYKECKRIFKITEKVYKQYAKNPNAVPDGMNNTDAADYEKNRLMYKSCRYDYLGHKTAYKLLFKLGIKLIPVPKI